MYNNETGLHEEDDWLRDGQWFEDEEGYLYIIPTAEAVAECEGPDNAIMDAINTACRENNGVVPEAVAEALGLKAIPAVLRRFSPEDGYYHD